mmetsp:Transcript_13638/g.27122  ORF Transcript_13638/g.27122 Transcript_13638/m.27122 type:complete len:87 (-) Transcript_13638:47-307(-)
MFTVLVSSSSPPPLPSPRTSSCPPADIQRTTLPPFGNTFHLSILLSLPPNLLCVLPRPPSTKGEGKTGGMSPLKVVLPAKAGENSR